LNVQPATAYEAVVNIGTTGLAGTLRLRTIDNDGGVTQAAASTGITEVAYGVYSAERTSPATVGNYTLVWDGGTNNDVRSIEELLVTRSGPAPLTSGPNYLTADELKATLALTGQVFADDDLDLAISAASAAVNEACSRRFYPVTETRYFTATGGNWYRGFGLYVETGDLVSVTDVDVDLDGDGTYEAQWTEGVEFTLEPFAAVDVGRPYRQLQLAGYPYPTSWLPARPRAVRIAGTFGWSATPPQVKAFTSIIAAKLVARLREREARLGIASLGGDESAAIRLARTDPDFEFYLAPFIETGPLVS
jgi:hypothetical protein